ncbi:MAG: sortase [Bacilli bacterium]|nr:sortase [Bacilli bacterium]
MQKNKTNYKMTIILGVILITFGITLMSNNYIKTKREETFNDMNLLLLDSSIDEVNTEESNDETPNEEVDEEPSKSDTSNNYEPYLAVLKIPKLNLERGFYDKTSSLNNVDYNILFHSNSDYPDKLNGNVILASHSGTSSISYFKNLYKLELGDEAQINYKNTTYTYKVVNIYKEEKDGTIAIYRNKEKSTLTLITCTKNDNAKQTVYILERI